MNPNDPSNLNVRRYLLQGMVRFAERASRLSGVRGIFLVGSLTTNKADSKDADVLVEVTPETDLKALAKAGRKLKGHAQQINKGADIFLAQDGSYLGRTCGYRVVFYRQACLQLRCVRDRPHLCDTSKVVRLADSLVAMPPIRLWPEFKASIPVPEDVQEISGSYI